MGLGHAIRFSSAAPSCSRQAVTVSPSSHPRLRQVSTGRVSQTPRLPPSAPPRQEDPVRLQSVPLSRLIPLPPPPGGGRLAGPHLGRYSRGTGGSRGTHRPPTRERKICWSRDQWRCSLGYGAHPPPTGGSRVRMSPSASWVANPRLNWIETPFTRAEM